MSMVKVIEVLAQSEKRWEDAVQNAVEEAARTLKGIQSVYASDFQAKVENDKVVLYRAKAKISFLLER